MTNTEGAVGQASTRVDSATVDRVGFLVLLAASSVTPLAFLTRQWPGRPSVSATVLLVAVTWCFGVLVWLCLNLLKVANGWIGGSAAAIIFVSWTFLDHFLPVGTGPGIRAALGVLVALWVALAVAAVVRERTARTVFAWVIMGLAMGGAVNLAQAIGDQAPPLEVEPVVASGASGHLPDVYFLVLDAYAREDVLSELFGFDNSSFLNELRSKGFVIGDQAVSEYSMTVASLSSTLMMDHVVAAGSPPGNREPSSAQLYNVMSGQNPTVLTLKGAGYEYVHLESGWGGTRCGHHVDICVRSRWEETAESLAQLTPFGEAYKHLAGSAFARAAVGQFDELHQVATESGTNPRFVAAHFILPHAPLFTTADCSIQFDERHRSPHINSPLVPDHLIAARRAAYVDQVQCVNSEVLEFLHQVDPSAIVVLISDHGPDSLGQLFVKNSEWTDIDRWERMSVLNAIRFPGCETADAYGVDLFTVLFGCLLGTGQSLTPDRQFVMNVNPDDPVVEVPAPVGDG